MNSPISLYRKRLIPNELIHLKDDLIIYQDDSVIITKWNTLHPRKDIARGISLYLIKEGYKISKIYNSKEEIVYWYCDIIRPFSISNLPDANLALNAMVFEDLLLDILVYEDGSTKVLDIDELAEALEKKLITPDAASLALYKLNTLLQIIYSGEFDQFKITINDAERNSLFL